MNRLTNLGNRLRMHGPGSTLKYVFTTIRPYHWNIFEVVRTSKTSKPECIGTSLQELRALRSGLTEPDFFRDTAGCGERCYFACVGGKLAGIAWVLDSRHPSGFIRFAEGDAELAAVRVLPEFRRQGVMSALIAYGVQDLKDSGIKRIYVTIEKNNIASFRGFNAVTDLVKLIELHRPPLFGPRFISAENRAESWSESFCRIGRQSKIG